MLLPKELNKVGNMVGGHGRQAIALSPCTKTLGEGSLVDLGSLFVCVCVSFAHIKHDMGVHHDKDRLLAEKRIMAK